MTILATEERSVPLEREASADYAIERTCRLNATPSQQIVARRDENASGGWIATLPVGTQNCAAHRAGISGTPAVLVLDETRLRRLNSRCRHRIDRNAAGRAELISAPAMYRSGRRGSGTSGPGISDGAVVRRDDCAKMTSARGRFVAAGSRADAGVRS